MLLESTWKCTKETWRFQNVRTLLYQELDQLDHDEYTWLTGTDNTRDMIKADDFNNMWTRSIGSISLHCAPFWPTPDRDWKQTGIGQRSLVNTKHIGPEISSTHTDEEKQSSIQWHIFSTGTDGAVAKSLANGLLDTGFTSQYRLNNVFHV